MKKQFLLVLAVALCAAQPSFGFFHREQALAAQPLTGLQMSPPQIGDIVFDTSLSGFFGYGGSGPVG